MRWSRARHPSLRQETVPQPRISVLRHFAVYGAREPSAVPNDDLVCTTEGSKIMSKDVNVDELRSELDELHKSRRDIERLIERKKLLMLRALPGVHGFESMDSFIRALSEFASQPLRELIVSADNVASSHGRGVRYTAEQRVAVRKELEAGQSPSAIARTTGMSLATIARWKQLWGLAPNARGRRASNTVGQKGAVSEASVTAGKGNGGKHDVLT